MPVPYQLTLSELQRAELVQTRDHARQLYLRERAAALLKIASGQSIQVVVQQRGITPPSPRYALCLGPSLPARRLAGSGDPKHETSRILRKK